MSVEVTPRTEVGGSAPGGSVLGDTVGAEPDEHFIDAVEHPAARSGQVGSFSAARAVVLVVVALVTATLLNSEGVVRAGEGMSPGVSRTLTLSAARPINSFAAALGLGAPREALAAALGQEDLSGGDIVDDGRAAIVVPAEPVPGRLPAAAPAREITLRTPTRADPLRVLVTGDSLATYVGLQLTNLTESSGLVSVTMLTRNGTGLTNPSYFNWQKAARTDMAKRDPEVVLMIIGGNDGWPMDTPPGQRVQVGDDDWIAEYARRAAAVMSTFQGDGRAVYWSGPPTARAARWDTLYRKINRADAAAADALVGAVYVDLYSGTAVDGRYSEYVQDGAKRIKARQPDGIHWSLAGSRLPARILLDQLETAVGERLR